MLVVVDDDKYGNYHDDDDNDDNDGDDDGDDDDDDDGDDDDDDEVPGGSTRRRRGWNRCYQAAELPGCHWTGAFSTGRLPALGGGNTLGGGKKVEGGNILWQQVRLAGDKKKTFVKILRNNTSSTSARSSITVIYNKNENDISISNMN